MAKNRQRLQQSKRKIANSFWEDWHKLAEQYGNEPKQQFNARVAKLWLDNEKRVGQIVEVRTLFIDDETMPEYGTTWIMFRNEYIQAEQ